MAVVLSDYLTDVRSLLNDPNNQFSSTTSMTSWINKARRRIAGETQCIRVLPPGTGTVASIAPTSVGSGYTVATVAISGPDGMGSNFVNATATANIVGGAITSYTITNAGTGYVNTPTVTISGDGAGAVGTATLTAFVHTILGQEVYTFASVNPILQANAPGVNNIIGVQSVSCSWGSWKPVLSWRPWTWLQAYARSNNLTLQNYPTLWAQYAQGDAGSIYLYPLPSLVAQMEWDCYCQPIALTNDASVEALPGPWTDAVPLLAGYYAYLQAQRRDDAQLMVNEYKRFCRENRNYVQPSMVPDFYGAG